MYANSWSSLLFSSSAKKWDYSSALFYILIRCSFLVSSIYLTGFPPKIVLGGMKVWGGTTELQAIIEFSPITDPSQITVLSPIITPSLTLQEIKEHPEWIVTQSPIVTDAISIFPGMRFKVMMETLSSILHCSPIVTLFISPLITVWFPM